MTVGPTEAAATLVDIELIARRVKQSSWYRSASTTIIAWGVLIALGFSASHLAPRSAPVIWLTINAVGVVATAALNARLARKREEGFDARGLIAILLFFGFGLLWSQVLGRFGAREMSAFWPTLFMFGYAVAGLWLGRAFVVIGLLITALTMAGYVWIDRWFDLYLALVAGGGLILCGLWMRRA
jgi:hypothetical protein